LQLQWFPEQIAGKLPVRLDPLYLHLHVTRRMAMINDNGKDFSRRAEIDEALSSMCYFPMPFASLETLRARFFR
jgi:IS30 family transposase